MAEATMESALDELMDAPQQEAVVDPVAEAIEEPVVAEDVDEAKVDGRKISPQWRALKETAPDQYKEYVKLRLGKDGFDQKMSGRDLDGILGFLDQNGGQESLATKLGELATSAEELGAIQQALETGDRSLVERFAEAPGFNTLAPAVLAKYSETDPDGYNAAMAGVFASTIAGDKIGLRLEKIQMQMEFAAQALGDNPQALNILKAMYAETQGLSEWAGKFGPLASKAPGAGGATQDKGAAGWQQEKEQFVQQQFTSDLSSTIEANRSKAIENELASFISKRKDDAEAKGIAIQTVRARVVERLAADKDFNAKLEAFAKRRDKAGAAQFVASREKEAIADIAPVVGRSIYGTVAAATVKAAPAVVKPRVVPPSATASKRSEFDAIWDS